MAFALAGHEGMAKMAIDDCIEAVESLDPSQRTWMNVKASLRGAVKLVKDEYIDRKPFEEREGQKFDLLIAVRCRPDLKARLLYTSDAALVATDTYECLGSGSYLARYIIGPAFRYQMDGQSALLLAVRALAEAKKHDIGCGGGSSFTLLTDEGPIASLGEYPVDEMERFTSEFDALINRIRATVFNGGSTQDQVENDLLLFGQATRAVWKTLRESPGVGYLFRDHRALDRFIEEAQPSPPPTIADQ